MKQFILFSAILCGLASSVAGQVTQQTDSAPPPPQGWVHLTSGTTAYLSTLSLIGRDTIYASGATCIRSTDAGTTWQLLVGAPKVGVLRFVDAMTGFLCNSTDTVYRTSDGGASWHAAFTGLPGGLGPDAMVFESRDSGWVTAGANIARTIDGGKTWIIYSPGILDGHCMTFPDSKHGFIMGSTILWHAPYNTRAAAFQRTIDGGRTWTLIYAGSSLDGNHSGAPRDVGGIFTISPDTIFAVGDRMIAWSRDGGFNWDTIPALTSYEAYYGVTFSNRLNGYAVGSNGWIIHSSDGGLSWQRQSSGVTDGSYLHAVAFSDSITGYVVGENGVILKTSNGGLSWVRLTPGIDTLQGFVNPNPSNDRTSITYTLPQPQHVTLTLLDLSGSTQIQLVANSLQEGVQSVDVNTINLPSGTYFYTLDCEKYHTTGKIEVIH